MRIEFGPIATYLLDCYSAPPLDDPGPFRFSTSYFSSTQHDIPCMFSSPTILQPVQRGCGFMKPLLPWRLYTPNPRRGCVFKLGQPQHICGIIIPLHLSTIQDLPYFQSFVFQVINTIDDVSSHIQPSFSPHNRDTVSQHFFHSGNSVCPVLDKVSAS